VGIDIMTNDEAVNEIDSIIDEMKNVDYDTLGEKVRNEFETYYTTFKEEFENTTNSTKNELIEATYNVSLESLNSALQYLGYSYNLILAITKASEEFDIEFDSNKLKAMKITNNYVEKIINNVDTSINADVSDLLLKLKEKNYE
jgi:hypothetical protein